VRKVIVDTAHLRGNFPDRFSLEGCLQPGSPGPADDTHLDADHQSQHRLCPDREHTFVREVIADPQQRFSHVRLNIFPTAASAACASTGWPTGEPMSLDEFNALPAQEARDALALCCVSERWIDRHAGGRPYDSRDTLPCGYGAQMHSPGQSARWRTPPAGLRGHPKIGDVSSLREKYAASGHLAAGEQAGVSGADDDDVLERLARANREYEERFGFIFIVCATGKSAAEMWSCSKRACTTIAPRSWSSPPIEQGRILQLRLEKLL
jgi:2-oxo-4-hydroxy-4-carboxy-5-ureidoimidazoline decarboxylase